MSPPSPPSHHTAVCHGQASRSFDKAYLFISNLFFGVLCPRITVSRRLGTTGHLSLSVFHFVLDRRRGEEGRGGEYFEQCPLRSPYTCPRSQPMWAMRESVCVCVCVCGVMSSPTFSEGPDSALIIGQQTIMRVRVCVCVRVCL